MHKHEPSSSTNLNQSNITPSPRRQPGWFFLWTFFQHPFPPLPSAGNRSPGGKSEKKSGNWKKILNFQLLPFSWRSRRPPRWGSIQGRRPSGCRWSRRPSFLLQQPHHCPPNLSRKLSLPPPPPPCLSSARSTSASCPTSRSRCSCLRYVSDILMQNGSSWLK